MPEEVYVHRGRHSANEAAQGNIIDQRRFDIHPAYLVGEIFDEGAGQISFPEFLLYIPVPVSERAISPSIPDAKNEPGSNGHNEGDQMQSAGLLPYPSCKIKQGEHKMENGKKDIEKMKHGCLKVEKCPAEISDNTGF